ncbi:hypothetical protein DRQ50_08650 [bacterium]|nr:MAG: hypothetical protein DRQ50_08650 [bacterium]
MDNNRTRRLLLLLIGLSLSTVMFTGVCLAADPTWDPRAWTRYNGWEVTAFDLSGAPPGMDSELAGGLEGTGSWKLLTGMRRPPFNAGKLLDDLRRIRYHLSKAGYPASMVVPVLTPDSAARTIGVLLEIDVGPSVLVTDVRYHGWPGDVARPESDEPHLMAPGDTFTAVAYDEMIVFLYLWLHDAGYALAEIEVILDVVSDTQVAFDVRVEAGEFYRITDIEIQGCSEDLVPVARRVMDIPVDSEFSASRLADAAADLRSTQLFRAAELVTETRAPGELLLRAELADARMRNMQASIGTWNDNPWMVRAGWSHRNLFSRGRGIYTGGTYATHVQSLGVAYYWLGWLSPRARTSLATEWVREDEDAYLSEEYRVEIIQSFRPRNRALSNLGIGLSNVDVLTRSPDDDDIPDDQDWLLEFWFDRKWDWTNHIMFPTRGGYFKIGLTYAPSGGPFKSAYVKTQADIAMYQPLDEKFVLAGRLRLGWSRPLGEATDLLANRRFYAGGFNTMRGYERRQLGPLDSSNNPRGGQVIALAGVETRMRLVGKFDLAVFADSGQVWRERAEAEFGELALAVGVDIDFRSPLGPIRVGHAWNIEGLLPGRPRTLWHFGIGYPW